MARQKITTPLDLNNMENHNGNYKELYGLIDETDKRISQNMWEEIKDANTMKMLEPVQTASELPTEAQDKSLITVIDEQRVYGFVNGEWQPFSEIDLDPFGPFKDELATIVATYEEKIQTITTEVQTTKDSAIDSIQSTQTSAESNINQTEQSAIESINQVQTDAEGQISTIRDGMSTQASELTALFNDYLTQLTNNRDTTLAEVESAKQNAITALEEFNNTDTSNWQKYKLTEENGDRISIGDIDVLILTTGFFECWNISGVPHDEASRWFIDVYSVIDHDAKLIKATLGYTGDAYQRTIYGSSDSGWLKLTGSTSELYNGNVSVIGSTFTLNDDPSNYAYLMAYGTNGDGDFIYPAVLTSESSFFVKDLSIYADAGGAIMYEIECQQGVTPTEYTIANSLFYRIHTDVAEESSTAVITKIVGVK